MPDLPPVCRFCCWKDRECDNPDHYYRPDCPVCLGAGVIDPNDLAYQGRAARERARNGKGDADA